jgi:hypothetical protein
MIPNTAMSPPTRTGKIQCEVEILASVWERRTDYAPGKFGWQENFRGFSISQSHFPIRVIRAIRGDSFRSLSLRAEIKN